MDYTEYWKGKTASGFDIDYEIEEQGDRIALQVLVSGHLQEIQYFPTREAAERYIDTCFNDER